MTSPTHNPNECPVDQVEQLAKGPQDQPIPPELCQHLEQCADCRARLEAAAAPELDWARVRRVLKIQPLPEQDNAAKVGLNFSLLRLLSPSDDPGIVGKIGPFEITEVIGSGGMGLVLKGRDPALDRFVAVKILAPHLASSATARRRFGREARAAAAVIHDNVIAIYQVSEHHELPYLVMPYLPDPSLQQRLDLQGKLDLESALSIALQVANGLQAAHSQGLIHRDIKPANVLLAKGTERAIITDFGLARAADDASLTSSGILAGTPHYMSPEQARGEAVDARSDLFSLGSLIYAMVAGTPPVNRELASETIRAIAAEPMPRLKTVAPDIPDWVARLVAWLHQTAPENRPQSALEIAEVLEQCLIHLRQPESHPLPERLTTAEEPAMANPKDNRLFSLIALFLFLGTLLSPALIAMTTRDEYALAFGAICAVLALAFSFLSWSEAISRGVAKTLGGMVLAACVGLVVLAAIFEFRGGDKLRRLQEESRAAMAAVLEKEKAKIGKDKNAFDEKIEEGGARGQELNNSLKNYPPNPNNSSPKPKGSSDPSNGTTPPANLGSGNPGGSIESEAGKPKPVLASAPLSQAEQLKKLLGEGEPEFAWNKPTEMAFPELFGTWKATKASLNGKDYRPTDSQNSIWLVVNSYGLKLMENTLPEPGQNALELGQGPVIAHPFPTVGDNAHRFAIPIGTFRRTGQEKAFATINALFSITPDKGGDKLRIAFSEGDPEQKTGASRDFFELERVSPLVPKAIRDGRPFAAKPFACSTGKVAPITVPALAGTWEVTKANLQKTDFLGKHSEAKLKILSDGIFLTLLLEEPRPRRRILGHGKLESWQPNSQGFFRIDCGSQTSPWLKGRFEKSSSGDLKLTLSNEEKGVPMPNNLLAHLVREDYLEGKKVTEDPLLSMKKTPSQGWGTFQNRENGFSPPSYGYFRHYLFPCANPIELADSANWKAFDYAPDPESTNTRMDPWIISEKDGTQKLTVQLAEPLKGVSQVSFVTLEPFGPGSSNKGAYNSDSLKEGDKIAIFHNVPAGPYQVILKLTPIPSKAHKLGEIEVIPGKEIVVQPKKNIGQDP